MSDPVNLIVPLDARFRAIGPDLAGKYCAAVGGSDADAASVTSAVTRAVDGFVSAGTPGDIAMSFRAPAGQVEVTLRCGGRSEVVTHPLPAPKG